MNENVYNVPNVPVIRVIAFDWDKIAETFGTMYTSSFIVPSMGTLRSPMSLSMGAVNENVYDVPIVPRGLFSFP